MKIKNVSSGVVMVSDLPGIQGGQGLTLQAGAEHLLHDEEAEKSGQLASLMQAGVISKLSDEEPNDAGAAADKDLTALAETYAGRSSHQMVAADLTLGAAAGSSAEPKYLAPIMGNLFGAALTATKNYLAGIIGAYSATGTRATTYPAGAVLGQITDGVTEADGAVVAYIDGDSALTKANAAFKAMSNNSTPGSGFDFGLDLLGAAHDGYPALAILKADLRLSSDVCHLSGAGAPVNGVSGTGAGFAGPGSQYTDRSAATIYLNSGTKASPTWASVGGASFQILALDSNPGPSSVIVGDYDQTTFSVAGLLATDTILSVTPKVPPAGGGAGAIFGFLNQADGSLSVQWNNAVATPGTVIRVAVKR